MKGLGGFVVPGGAGGWHGCFESGQGLRTRGPESARGDSHFLDISLRCELVWPGSEVQRDIQNAVRICLIGANGGLKLTP
jgi:hypothetical protein